MSGSLFGELYLRSTRPFLSEQVTRAEVGFLRSRLPLDRDGLVLDVGCGHGRHLGGLAAPGTRALVVGVDLDPLSLTEAQTRGPVVRADFFRLPFADRSARAVVSWYNSLFTFEDDAIRRLVRELARVLVPGGQLVVQGTHIETPRARPSAQYDGPLPDGSRLVERCQFDPTRRRDDIHRELTTPDGRVMAAAFSIRYYPLDEWAALLAEAGLGVAWVCGGVDGRPLERDSLDQIVGAVNRG